MLSHNYISGTNVRDVIDVVSVMAAYFDLLCVCIVHRAEGYCVRNTVSLCTAQDTVFLTQYPSAWCTIHTHNRSKYAAITLTTSITTRTLVPDM